MPVRSHRTNWVYTTAISWRLLAQRFSFVLFLALALGLLVVGRSKPVLMEHVRVRVVDGMTPVAAARAQRNVERDLEITHRLEDAGWTVVRFWEHDDPADVADSVGALVDRLSS